MPFDKSSFEKLLDPFGFDVALLNKNKDPDKYKSDNLGQKNSVFYAAEETATS